MSEEHMALTARMVGLSNMPNVVKTSLCQDETGVKYDDSLDCSTDNDKAVVNPYYSMARLTSNCCTQHVMRHS